MIYFILSISLIVSLISLSVAWLFHRQIMKKDPGTEKMQAITAGDLPVLKGETTIPMKPAIVPQSLSSN